MQDEITLDDLSERLADDPRRVCEALGLDGGPEPGGRLWRCKRQAAGGAWGDSFSIELAAGRAGKWNHAAAGRGGKTLLGLVEYVRGLGWKDAADWAREHLGIEAGRPLPAPAPRPVRQAGADEAEQLERRLDRARRIWREAVPAEGTLAEVYLRGRGIRHGLPPSLRFAPRCWHDLERRELPALIGGVQGPGGELVGVWRIYLADDGRAKAAAEPARLGLGNVRGGAVRLGRVVDRVAICEGVETGLAARELLPRPVWCCLSTSGIRGVELPPSCAEVMIVADHDFRDEREFLEFRRPDGSIERRPNGMFGKRPGLIAAQAAEARFVSEGRRVCIVMPPIEGQDYNDMVKL